MTKEQLITDKYAIYNSDCMLILPTLENNSIDFSVYSPPFAGLYNYSSSENDFSNCETKDQFLQQYEYLIKEISRITKPGRITAVHCTDIMNNKTGKLWDFPNEIIKLHEKFNFSYRNKITIWKEPLKVRMRTEKYGTFEQLKKKYEKCEDPKTNKLSHIIWQRYASSVWDDIRIDEVLKYKESKDEDDEKHVHPLQLDVIDRLVELYSNIGEIVLTPFMGVGSEVYSPVSLGRKAIGIELKDSYYKQAIQNLKEVEYRYADNQLSLI
jgi:DNA modification methylase